MLSDDNAQCSDADKTLVGVDINAIMAHGRRSAASKKSVETAGLIDSPRPGRRIAPEHNTDDCKTILSTSLNTESLVPAEAPSRCEVTEAIPSPRRPTKWWLYLVLAVSFATVIVAGNHALNEQNTNKPVQKKAAEPSVATPTEPIAKPLEVKTKPAVEEDSINKVQVGEGSCSVEVDSKRPGAVHVAGKAVGTSPILLTGLWCGRSVRIQVRSQGYRVWSQKVVPQEGRLSKLRATPKRRRRKAKKG